MSPITKRVEGRTALVTGSTVVFLASDDAGNIHGAVLSVDGGWAAV